MKVQVLLLLLGAAVVAATSEPFVGLPQLTDEQNCLGIPGDRWRKDCNWCTCRNGRGTCTRRLCRRPGEENEMPQCEGNPLWKDGCNTCACNDGQAICTPTHCGDEVGSPTPQVTQTVTQVMERPADKQCEDGSRWRVECNWCVCVGGRSRCTEAACVNWDEGKAREDGIIQCHGEAQWKKDCNWCKCVNGLGVCTLRACIPPERNPFHGLPENAMCVPGSRWMLECNWCNCGSTGNAACTLKGCLPGYRSDGPTCEDGSVWKSDDCNICRCIDGVSACTKRLCPERNPFQGLPAERNPFQGLPAERNPFHGLPENAVCVPGSRWMLECNWCDCGSTGNAACTLRGCLPGYRPNGPTCEDGSVWKSDDCNICRCIDGFSACTKRLCRTQQPPSTSPQLPQVPEEPQCQGDPATDRWRMDCNWCRCRNGVGACTRRLCREGVKDESPECEGNPSWMKDCNRCSCVNGTAVCTLKLCGPLPPRPGPHEAAQEPECQGDPETDSWTQDCNRCTCRNGVGSCTKRLCREDEEDLPVCRGNPSWKKDCNRCHCNNGTAVCTTMYCGGPLGPKMSKKLQKTSVKNKDAVCVAGSRWRVGCNWCSCRGGMAICTQRACLDQSAESNEPECVGDATWKSDCNWCTCGDGLAVCTRMACLKPIDKPCTEGTSWRDDCNICRCSQGFVLCTKKACATYGRQLECQGDSCEPRQLPELCHLPPVQGHKQCAAFFQKWSFSMADGMCQQIIYGGCGGSENLFNSKQECDAVCPPTITTADTSTKITFPATRTAHLERIPCNLPQDPGPCFAAFPRYAYNAANGLCEEFLYGGCEGNGNNFKSMEACQAACQGNQEEASCDKSKCPWSLWGHYLAKDCVPQYAGDACCPTSFQCPSASESGKDPTKCHYRGVSYSVGDSVPVKEPCSASCHCSESYDLSGLPEIKCANVECPELFRPPRPGCLPLYSAESCCPTDYECEDPDTPPLEVRSVSCSWQNQTYLEGSKMYFKDYPCQACICGPEFTGPTGPGCFKIDCGLEFRYTSEYRRGCTPIRFEDDGCCPISWMCPDDSRIEPQQQQQQPETTLESSLCHLGERRLAVGEKLGLTDCKIECRCMTPPELTCIQYRSCELAQEVAAERVCPPLECNIGCHPVVSGPGQCPTCSCSQDTYSCPAQTCPSNCRPELDLQTGCPSCKCQCPEVFCPPGCPSHTVLEEATGCPRCECMPGSVQLRNPDSCPVFPGGVVPCPQDCAVIRRVDEIGCQVCECDPNDPGYPFGHPMPTLFQVGNTTCHIGPDGHAPCPMDCAIIRRMDENGCEVCECDPNDTGNPFGRPLPPNFIAHDTACPTGPDGQAPCPMDCAIIRRIDENGCEVCECNPENPGNPFYRPVPPDLIAHDSACVYPDGQAPCPMDCGIIRYKDENGCEVCECDPDNHGNPFGPPSPPQRRVRRSCPGKWDAPCPQDCGVIRYRDGNGCWVCDCDPNDTGNPFYRPLPPRPTQDRNRRACPGDWVNLCPQDCGVIRYRDRNGCLVCECDPNNTGNPFHPYIPYGPPW